MISDNYFTADQIEDYNQTKAVRFVLGEDDTCSESLTTRSYCNGPLKPDTAYQIRMRAFTNGGYIDSKAIIAKTSKTIYFTFKLEYIFLSYNLSAVHSTPD